MFHPATAPNHLPLSGQLWLGSAPSLLPSFTSSFPFSSLPWSAPLSSCAPTFLLHFPPAINLLHLTSFLVRHLFFFLFLSFISSSLYSHNCNFPLHHSFITPPPLLCSTSPPMSSVRFCFFIPPRVTSSLQANQISWPRGCPHKESSDFDLTFSETSLWDKTQTESRNTETPADWLKSL